MTDLLNEAVQKLKQGDTKAGYTLLKQIISTNPQSQEAEKAWLWMATILKGYAKKKRCLENALRINPDNQSALNALAKLEATRSSSRLPDPEPDEIISGPAPTGRQPAPKRKSSQAAAPEVYAMSKDAKKRRFPRWLIILGGLVFICVILPVCGLIFSFSNGDAQTTQSTLPATYTPGSMAGASAGNAETSIRVSRTELAAHFESNHGFVWRENTMPPQGLKQWSGYSDFDDRERMLIVWTPENSEQITEMYYNFAAPSGFVSESLGQTAIAEQQDLLALAFPEWEGSSSWLLQRTNGFRQQEREVYSTEIEGHIVELDIGPAATTVEFLSQLTIYKK